MEAQEFPEEITEQEPVQRAPNAVELAAAYKISLDYVDANIGDMTDEEFDTVAKTETALHDKIGGYGAAIKIHKREVEFYKTQAAILDDAAAELKNKAKAIENQAEWKRGRIFDIMNLFEIKSVKGPFATVTVKDVAPSLDVVNEALALEALPEEFIVTTRKLDKKPLLNAIKSGDDFADCGIAMKENQTTLQVR